MLKSLLGIVEDVAAITAAPVKITAGLTRAVTKPLADAAKDAAKAVGELSKDNGGREDV